jgi:CIC family chloride channel protein
MEYNVIAQPYLLTRKQVYNALKHQPLWILIEEDKVLTHALLAADLARYVEDNSDNEIDLMAIPAERKQLANIHLQASLQDALKTLNATQAEALYIVKHTANQKQLGILMRENIENHYRSNL